MKLVKLLTIPALMAGLALAVGPLSAAEEASSDDARITQGKAIYEYWCTPCHGRGLGRPGTVALEAKYDGAVPALLEERTDLTPEVVAYFVRNGVSIMPFFRKTEISDEELAALGAYLSQPAEQ